MSKIETYSLIFLFLTVGPNLSLPHIYDVVTDMFELLQL